MFPSRKACRVGCIHTVFIRSSFQWRNDTVGREQDGSVEALELFPLFPPGISVVTDKMFVFLEGRVLVGSKHFAVRIYIDSGSFRLCKQLFHIFQVMAANQNGRIVAYTDVYLCDLRITVTAGIGLVE